jgi:Putative peptidoglycan binding domain/CHAP domain
VIGYPGKLVQRKSRDAAIVEAIQKRLLARGYPIDDAQGVFGASTEAAVMLFQSQQVDILDRPLRVDGVVGPNTWAALFPETDAAITREPFSALSAMALATAASQIGVREDPPLSNAGPRVDEYLATVGIGDDTKRVDQRAWCAAFVYWCFDHAARLMNVSNPCIRTPGVLKHWSLSANNRRATRVLRAEAIRDPSLVRPGMVMILDYTKGLGHTGIVERNHFGGLVTVEGNIAERGDPGRDGIGVFRTSRRKITDDRLVGFIGY